MCEYDLLSRFGTTVQYWLALVPLPPIVLFHTGVPGTGVLRTPVQQKKILVTSHEAELRTQVEMCDNDVANSLHVSRASYHSWIVVVLLRSVRPGSWVVLSNIPSLDSTTESSLWSSQVRNKVSHHLSITSLFLGYWSTLLLHHTYTR